MSFLARALRGKRQTRQAFAGAVVNRLNDFVFSTIQSANQELRSEVVTLRGRARELCRNNPNAKRFLNLLRQNVVGPKGIRLESQVTLKTGPNAGKPDEVANDRIESAWKEWGKPGNCDVTRRHSWVSFQNLAITTAARDGEAFVRLIDGFNNAFGFAVQLLDADQVDTTYTVPGGRGQPRVEQGVELDDWGAPVAYHVLTAHPSDPVRERRRERIPAKDILHLYIVERETQARGIPWFAPVTVAMRMLDGYNEAELVAARTAAAKMGFIVPGEDAPGPDPDLPADQAEQVMEATPGAIDRLEVGETFQPWDPQHPAGNYEPFVLAQQRLLSMGLNVSHMSLTGDLRQANYSSARVGLLDERDGWRALQGWLTEHLHEPVYRRWLRIASLSPRLTLPTYDLTKYEAVVWRARGWDWVDPLKDIAAIESEIQLGLTTATEQCAERGVEFIDNMKGRRRELDIAASYNIVLGSDPAVQETINTVSMPDGQKPPVPGADTSDAEDDATDPATNGKGRGALRLARFPHERTA